jgi:hypothetical protein
VHERHEQLAPLVAVRERGLVVTVDRATAAVRGRRAPGALERRFYDAAAAGFARPRSAPPTSVAGRESRDLAPTSYKLGVAPARIDALLPEWIRDALRGALARFERDIPGFVAEGQFVGIESRSSGAVRLPRAPDRAPRPASRTCSRSARARLCGRDHERGDRWRAHALRHC